MVTCSNWPVQYRGFFLIRLVRPSIFKAKIIVRNLCIPSCGDISFYICPIERNQCTHILCSYGILWLSTVPLTTGLIAQTQGLKFLSTLAGLVFFSHQVGGFLGAWLGGRLYDLTGNYEAMWIAAILFGLLATVIHLPIRETAGKLAQVEFK